MFTLKPCYPWLPPSVGHSGSAALTVLTLTHSLAHSPVSVIYVSIYLVVYLICFACLAISVYIKLFLIIRPFLPRLLYTSTLLHTPAYLTVLSYSHCFLSKHLSKFSQRTSHIVLWLTRTPSLISHSLYHTSHHSPSPRKLSDFPVSYIAHNNAYVVGVATNGQ